MTNALLRIVAIFMVANLALHGTETRVMDSARIIPQTSPISLLESEALSLPLAAAVLAGTAYVIHPEAFTHVYHALKSEWMEGMVLAASLPPWKRIKRSRQDPEYIQKLIGKTATRTEAVTILKKKPGWDVIPEGLSNFMIRHNLTAPWRRLSHKRFDPAVVQRLIGKTATRTLAVAILKKKLGWAVSPESLSIYMARHGLIAPWQKERFDPAVVQRLIGKTATRTLAVAILKKKLGWKVLPGALSKYMTRHGLTAPWKRLGATARGHKRLLATFA